MVSPRRKSKTGPNTPKGKIQSSLNAIIHGINSHYPVVNPSESIEAWEFHFDGIKASLAPEGHLELILVLRIAQILWRLERVVYFETAVIGTRNIDVAGGVIGNVKFIKEHAGKTIDPNTMAHLTLQETVDRLIPDNENLERIKRYEAHHHRMWIQTLHELEALQTRRKGGTTPLARLDITGAPGG
jgi:hypothetical protein